MRRILLACLLLSSLGWAQTYQTKFPLTENPISESGNWTNGLAQGLQWGDVRTTPGFAFGTTTTSSCAFGSGSCNDSTAVLTGTWGASQSVCSTVNINSTLSPNSNFEELELRLRTVISANSITGYEFLYSVRTDSARYAQVVKWNGPKNNFTVLSSNNAPPVIQTGDSLCATAVGSTLNFYRNGVLVVGPITDSTYTNGSPGIAMFNQGGTLADNALYGFSYMKADSPAITVPYSLPNDASCPGSCRQIPWQAGSDIWNSGTLPTYTQNTCSGLVGNGTTNDGPAIQACITAASANTAVFIPAGVYLVNTNLTLKSNVALRGAKASAAPFLPSADAGATTLKLGASGGVSFGSGSMGANTAIASGYTKGSTSITMNAGHGFVTNDWIIVAERADTGIGGTATGDNGLCTWCGENDGVNIMAQIVQATNVSGNVITLSRPLYYTFQSGFSPVARKVTFSVSKTGLENIRLDGSNVDHGAFINISNTVFPWVKGVETYEAGTAAKAAHVYLNFTYGAEIRDSYFHHGRDSSSDRNYGVFLFQVNSDNKVENNILRNNRHGIVFEAGGSGNAILYNYVDDQYVSSPDDNHFLGSSRANHGAHPYMNLFEGNIFSSLSADSIWGSSSHKVFFRNHIWGDETQAADVPVKPTFGFTPVLNVSRNQNYYAFIGNVIGISGKWANPNWASFGVRNTNCATFATSIYGYGCDSNNVYSATAGSTSINHGNWDIKTAGVAYWEGGTNQTLAASLYYGSKPAFFGSSAWPSFGPEGNPTVNSIPAKDRFDAAGALPPPPTGLTSVVH